MPITTESVRGRSATVDADTAAGGEGEAPEPSVPNELDGSQPDAAAGEPDGDAAEEAPASRQLRFDGIAIRHHKLAITGLVDLTDEEVKEYKAGKRITLTVTGTVRKRLHHFREDADSGERYVAHQVTLQIGEIEDAEE